MIIKHISVRYRYVIVKNLNSCVKIARYLYLSIVLAVYKRWDSKSFSILSYYIGTKIKYKILVHVMHEFILVGNVHFLNLNI
jgi:hypothetical protein